MDSTALHFRLAKYPFYFLRLDFRKTNLNYKSLVHRFLAHLASALFSFIRRWNKKSKQKEIRMSSTTRKYFLFGTFIRWTPHQTSHTQQQHDDFFTKNTHIFPLKTVSKQINLLGGKKTFFVVSSSRGFRLEWRRRRRLRHLRTSARSSVSQLLLKTNLFKSRTFFNDCFTLLNSDDDDGNSLALVSPLPPSSPFPTSRPPFLPLSLSNFYLFPPLLLSRCCCFRCIQSSASSTLKVAFTIIDAVFLSGTQGSEKFRFVYFDEISFLFYKNVSRAKLILSQSRIVSIAEKLFP